MCYLSLHSRSVSSSFQLLSLDLSCAKLSFSCALSRARCAVSLASLCHLKPFFSQFSCIRGNFFFKKTHLGIAAHLKYHMVHGGNFLVDFAPSTHPPIPNLFSRLLSLLFFFFGKYVYSSFGCLVSLLFARGRGGGGGGGGVLVLELVC